MGFSFSEAKSMFGAIAELYKKGANLEAEKKLMDLQSAFLDLQGEYLSLRSMVGELEAKLNEKEELSYSRDNGVYYLNKKDGTTEGPYCQLCYDTEGKLIRLKHEEIDVIIGMDDLTGAREKKRVVRFRCLNCTNKYNV